MLPLLLKERVAALVYADSGAESGGKMDAAALEVLVVSASAWLEVSASRKQGHKEPGAEPVEKHAAPAAAQSAPSFSDPFASHTPMHTAVAPPPSFAEIHAEPVVEYAAVATATAVAEAEPSSGAAAAVAMAPDPFSQMSPEDADLHRKAQRFARLLVDEIKLYNQAKVSEGRKSKDLYDRLKEDIDKSQASYQKRYGNTVAANAEYFRHELVRSLAEDDVSVMGTSFQR